MGLSPALSYESQSSHTLYPLSEPDAAVLPPSLDLSFAAEPSWDPAVYLSPQSVRTSLPDGYLGSVPALMPYGKDLDSKVEMTAPQSAVPRMHQPVFFDQGAQVANSRYPPVNRRPILPRTEASAGSNQPVYGPPRARQASSPLLHGARSTMSTVSNASGPPHEMAQQSPATSPAPVNTLPNAPRSSVSEPVPVTSRTEFAADMKPVGPSGYLNNAEDWNAFIHFDQDEQTVAPGSMRSDEVESHTYDQHTDQIDSYAAEFGSIPGVSSSAMDHMPAALQPELDAPQVLEAYPTATTGVPGENDEGRHRTHPLYSEGPHADGLYHCPFESESNCPHKPTKLKCNYEYGLPPPVALLSKCVLLTTDGLRSKFIDSHLKPFRCKVEACAKQEFSSTACLLRHEREAHGMHGHGDRPHLCFYAGCERGVPGNGFPRRYNLFDHMKRVHDHKEGPASASGSVVGKPQAPKKPGRKRKAAGSPTVEPDARRRKTLPASTGEAQPPPIATSHDELASALGQYQQPVEDSQLFFQKVQNRQRVLYSQWADQRDAIARQMDFVQSPDDEANLQRLSQNIEELRRLSQEARRG